jgi:predicted nucleotidyltransferase
MRSTLPVRNDGTTDHDARLRAVEHLAARFAEVPGVVAVTLGGSRARGEARPESDWDFGLYYRGTLDTNAIRAFGFEGDVFEPWDWGRIPNGGAWLTIDGEAVDLIYRDLDVVEHWSREAERGHFEIWREVGHTAGVPTYTLTGELALNQTLAGALPHPLFPAALRESAPPKWLNLASGALKFAGHHARNNDPVPQQANLAVALLQLAHAKCAKQGVWVLNEKRLITRAGLNDVPLSNDEVEAAVENEGSR